MDVMQADGNQHIDRAEADGDAALYTLAWHAKLCEEWMRTQRDASKRVRG